MIYIVNYDVTMSRSLIFSRHLKHSSLINNRIVVLLTYYKFVYCVHDQHTYNIPTVHSAIRVLLLPEQGFGTGFQPLCAHSTCPLNVSNGH